MRTPSHSTSRTWLIRVGWLMLIWVTSIVTLGIVAMVFRTIMSVAGMTA